MYRGNQIFYQSESVSRARRKKAHASSRKGKTKNSTKKSGKSRKPRKNWDTTVNDLNAYKLDPKEVIEKKLMCVSKHRSNAKELIREQKKKRFHTQQMEKEREQILREKKELMARKKDLLTHQSFPQFCASNHLRSISDDDDDSDLDSHSSSHLSNESNYESDCEISDYGIDDNVETNNANNGSVTSCDTEIGKNMTQNGSVNSYDDGIDDNTGVTMQSLQNMQSLIAKLDNRMSTLERNDSIISELKKTNEDIRLNVLDSINTQNSQILNLLQQLQSQQSHIFSLEKKVLDLEQKVSTQQNTSVNTGVSSINNDMKTVRVINHTNVNPNTNSDKNISAMPSQPQPTKSEPNTNFLILPPRAQKLSRRFLPLNTNTNPILVPKPESQPNVAPQPYPKAVNFNRGDVVPTFRVATIGGQPNKHVRIENIHSFSNEQ